MSSLSDHEPLSSASAAETPHSADYFGHAPALQVVLGGMLAIALLTLWFMVHLPFANGKFVVALIPVILIGYLGLRLYFAFSTVEFFGDHVDIVRLGTTRSIPYNTIRQIRFDSFSHDLLVRDDSGEYRIPRTIQGHRVILHRLHQRVEVERDHSPEMQVQVRSMPKVASCLSIAAMTGLSATVTVNVPAVGVGLWAVCIPTALLLLDQCVLRSYEFTPEQVTVNGLRKRTYRREDLKQALISKSGLSSQFEMTFANGKVRFDEYLLSKALIQVSGYVERRWQQRVSPVKKA
jgi:hypothetical protein